MKSKKIAFLTAAVVTMGSLMATLSPFVSKTYAAPTCYTGDASTTSSKNLAPYTGSCTKASSGGVVDDASNNCYVVFGNQFVSGVRQITCDGDHAVVPGARCFNIVGSVPNTNGGEPVPRYSEVDCFGLANPPAGFNPNDANKCYTVDKGAIKEEGCLKVFLQSIYVVTYDQKNAAANTNTASVSHVTNSTCSSANINSCGFFSNFVIPAVNFLSGGVVLIIIIMIVVGGIKYSAASDNPQASAAAKAHVYNAVIALLLYMFLFALLQWLIPGGIF